MSSEVGQHRRYVFAREFWRRRRNRRSAQRAPAGPIEVFRAATPGELTLELIADPENLLLAFEECKKGGQAPGPDGLSYLDFSLSEIAQVLRVAARAIRERRYAPGPTRRVLIPKPNGKLRELRLANIVDRVIAKAVAKAITPALDPVFLPGVYGFRRGRSQWQMLLDMERTMVEQGRWIVAQDDVRDAFPSVVISDVMNDFGRHIDNADVLWLIEALLRGHEGPRRVIGIDQGNAVSPVALILRLHYALDLPFTTAGPGNPPWHAWADNRIYLCRDVSEGHRALQQARNLLQQAGLSFKGEDGPPVNLRRQGAHTQVLGFCVKLKDDRLWYQPGRTAWTNLKQALEQAHRAPRPSQAAQQAANGWLRAYAPAFESVSERDVTRRVRNMVLQAGFDELDDGRMLRAIRDGREQWVRLRSRILRAPAAISPDVSHGALACSARRGPPAPTSERGRPPWE